MDLPVIVKKSLQFNVINELFVMDEKIFESLFINVQEGKKNIVCGAIYRSPVDHVTAHQDFRLQLIKCHEKQDAKRKCYIFGDFNYDLAKSNENSHVSDFIEVMLNHNFCSIINKPTRITDTSATVLDHIWTNAYTNPIKSGIVLHSVSNHLSVFMCADKSKATSLNILTRIFNDANMRKFNLDLQNIDVNSILNETKTNQSYMLLADRYHQVFDKSFPLIQINNNSKSSWFDKDLQKLLQIKGKVFKKYCAKKNLLSKVNCNKAKTSTFIL